MSSAETRRCTKMMARERARIGLAASEGDLSRRIVAYAYGDQEDSAADT